MSTTSCSQSALESIAAAGGGGGGVSEAKYEGDGEEDCDGEVDEDAAATKSLIDESGERARSTS